MGIREVVCVDNEGGRRTQAERARLARLRNRPVLSRDRNEEEARRLARCRNEIWNAKLLRERKATPYKMAVKRGEVATIDGTAPEELD